MNDFDQIKDAIREVARLYKLAILGVDPYLSREITGTLMKEGINVLEIRQTMAELSPPMKDIERKLRGGEMYHDHNTASRWNFGNVRCAVDGNENMKPMKNKSIGRIDITVAWIICHAAAMSEPENKLADLLATGKWSL
jgi:phage terminase large subunit-like protein